MSTTELVIDRGTTADRSPKHTEIPCQDRDHPWGAGAQAVESNTWMQLFEHFEAEVQKLGASKDRYSERTGPEFRRRLARGIRESDHPHRRIAAVVGHACLSPSQVKIEDSADVLSHVGYRLVSFIEDKDAEYFNQASMAFDDRVWLYAAALSWMCDKETRQRRIEILCRWLANDDSSIRESAANALGTLDASEAKQKLADALEDEEDEATRDAIADALRTADEAGRE